MEDREAAVRDHITRCTKCGELPGGEPGPVVCVECGHSWTAHDAAMRALRLAVGTALDVYDGPDARAFGERLVRELGMRPAPIVHRGSRVPDPLAHAMENSIYVLIASIVERAGGRVDLPAELVENVGRTGRWLQDPAFHPDTDTETIVVEVHRDRPSSGLEDEKKPPTA